MFVFQVGIYDSTQLSGKSFYFSLYPYPSLSISSTIPSNKSPLLKFCVGHLLNLPFPAESPYAV